LDNTLRVLLRDLAITRTERKKLEKGDVLVDVDRLLIGLKQRSRVEKKMALRRSPTGLLIRDWRIDRYKLRRMVRGGGSAGQEGDS
jgi:hypothetical protein